MAEPLDVIAARFAQVALREGGVLRPARLLPQGLALGLEQLGRVAVGQHRAVLRDAVGAALVAAGAQRSGAGYVRLSMPGGGVDAPHVPRSRSRETTFERDLLDRAEMEKHVAQMAHEVTDAVVAEGRLVTHVAVKVRTANFFTRTKISKLADKMAIVIQEIILEKIYLDLEGNVKTRPVAPVDGDHDVGGVLEELFEVDARERHRRSASRRAPRSRSRPARSSP